MACAPSVDDATASARRCLTLPRVTPYAERPIRRVNEFVITCPVH